MSKLAVNVPEILAFFDEDLSARKHSNAIKTVAGEEFMFSLLVEYFRRAGTVAKVVSRTCTTGKRKGPQLDGWVSIDHGGGDGEVLYQTEVKSWSAHGVGGGSFYLKGGAPAEVVSSFKQKVWKQYWSEGEFLASGLNKVLVPMKCPVPAASVRPLACLWAPVHPTGAEEPWFEVETDAAQPFRKVSVFSASAFLRNIMTSEKTLTLELPTLAVRIGLLGRLFASNDA